MGFGAVSIVFVVALKVQCEMGALQGAAHLLASHQPGGASWVEQHLAPQSAVLQKSGPPRRTLDTRVTPEEGIPVLVSGAAERSGVGGSSPPSGFTKAKRRVLTGRGGWSRQCLASSSGPGSGADVSVTKQRVVQWLFLLLVSRLVNLEGLLQIASLFFAFFCPPPLDWERCPGKATIILCMQEVLSPPPGKGAAPPSLPHSFHFISSFLQGPQGGIRSSSPSLVLTTTL